jgi:hypothetical protein
VIAVVARAVVSERRFYIGPGWVQSGLTEREAQAARQAAQQKRAKNTDDVEIPTGLPPHLHGH